MKRWLFKDVEAIATKYDLILERVGKRYELTSEDGSCTDVCTTLSEVLVCIGAHGSKYRSPQEVVNDLFDLIHTD